jgi:hypothetical protein
VATIKVSAVRPSSVLLILVAPTLLMIVGLGALDSDFAHPAYAEALVNFGVALLAWHRPGGTAEPAATSAAARPRRVLTNVRNKTSVRSVHARAAEQLCRPAHP